MSRSGERSGQEVTVAAALAEHLAALGVEQAFGVSGGAIAILYDALAESPIRLHHTRHENGAAFAATEAHFASGKPTAVFATTGPGLLNALTGVAAARAEGAKLVLLSGATSAQQRGRWATQETTSQTFPTGLYGRGALFDYAVRLEHAAELPEVARRLALGLTRAGGFVAHVAIPMAVQPARLERPTAAQLDSLGIASPALSEADLDWLASTLVEEPCVVWVGFGARHAAAEVRELVDRLGLPVFSTPRGKGIVPEDHPCYLGVTGLGGHDSVVAAMLQRRPEWTLVLGSRLGEASSFWDRDLVPASGFLHVDLDPDVPGTAYPDAETVGIHAEIGELLRSLLARLPSRTAAALGPRPARRELPVPTLPVADRSPVRPQVLMQAIQRLVVDGSEALVLAESGNSFAWCNHYLRFSSPGRYRVSTLFASMGHAAAGVVGAALAREGKAVAVVGDGSLLMGAELSTAVQYRVPAVWVVLNDAGYGMCRDGQRALGLSTAHIEFPRADFVALARSMGADGVAVGEEGELEAALAAAMAAPGPFVVDVRIDTAEASPLLHRFDEMLGRDRASDLARQA